MVFVNFKRTVRTTWYTIALFHGFIMKDKFICITANALLPHTSMIVPKTSFNWVNASSRMPQRTSRRTYNIEDVVAKIIHGIHSVCFPAHYQPPPGVKLCLGQEYNAIWTGYQRILEQVLHVYRHPNTVSAWPINVCCALHYLQKRTKLTGLRPRNIDQQDSNGYNEWSKWLRLTSSGSVLQVRPSDTKNP